MPHATLADTAVAVCDWNGKLIWTSRANPTCTVAAPLWESVPPEYAETVKAAVSRVVTLREPQQYEAVCSDGKYYHVWMWPLNSPEIAVAVLAVRVPQELDRLTTRERECLQWLGAGCSAVAIAKQLDVSVSTVHTHFKRARQKLLLSSTESLIGFAARYCYLLGHPADGDQSYGQPTELPEESPNERPTC